MKNKHIKQLLTLSTFGVLCLVSCGHERYTHNSLHSDINIYSADLDHNGTISETEKNLTWKESYDVLMSQISDRDSLSNAANAMKIAQNEPQRESLARYEIMHQAEEMLMDTGAVMPLYNYADPFLLKPNVTGIYSMGLGTKYLNQLERTNSSNKTFHLSVGTKADTLDPADNNDSSTSNMLNNCMRGLSYYEKNEDEVSKEQSRTYGSTLKWNDKILAEDPTFDSKTLTYTFKIKSDEDGHNYMWSDGSDITAYDFAYTWHRACSSYHGTWGFIFDCIKGYDYYTTWTNPATHKEEQRPQEQQKFWADDPQGKVAIEGIKIKNKYEFTVELTYNCSFFKELLSFTAFAPLQKAKMSGLDQRGKKVEVSTWFNNASNWVTNGPFKIVGINNKQTGTFDIQKNNENGCKAADAYGCLPDKIYYHLIDDDSAMYMDYVRNKYDMVDSFPTAMTDKIKNDLKNDYRVAQQIGNYYFFFNVNDNALDITKDESENDKEKRRAKLRKGLIRLVNRLDMVDTIVKSGATDGNGFVSKDIVETSLPGKTYDATDPDPEKKNTGLWCKRYKVDQGTGEKIEFNPNDSTHLADINSFTLNESDWHERNGNTHSTWETEGVDAHWLGNRTKGGFWKSTEDDDVPSSKTDSLKRQNIIMKANVEAGLEYIKDAIKGTNVTYDEKTGKFNNFPTLTITTNTGTGHESLCERLQYLYGLYGIQLKIETQEWTAFSAYIREGNVAMARNGWIADFSDARTYLELFTSGGSSNYCQLGKTKEKGAYIHKSQ